MEDYKIIIGEVVIIGLGVFLGKFIYAVFQGILSGIIKYFNKEKK